MIKKAKAHMAMAAKLARGHVVSSGDYSRCYDDAADTYSLWLEKMGRFTDRIIDFGDSAKGEIEILDLACGTGYVSLKAADMFPNARVTSVDISERMLKKLSEKGRRNIHTVSSDGMEFLRGCSCKYEHVFFAWALPYFEHKSIFRLIFNALKSGGALHIISNSRGTLCGVEKAFLNVMSQRPECVKNVMPISFNLPKGKTGLCSWAKSAGFKPIVAGEGEDSSRFSTAQELLSWLEMTGSLAGCQAIFKDYETIRPLIVKELEKTNREGDCFTINHKLAYGIFRKE